MPEPAKRESLAKHIGARLRRVRTAQMRTLLDVGNAVGTTPQTIQRLEMGTMSLSVKWVERLCHVYGIQPHHLFDDSPMTSFEGKLQQASARAAIKVLCRALNVPCHESLE